MHFLLLKNNYYRIRSLAVIASWLIWALMIYLIVVGAIDDLSVLLLFGGFVPYILANALLSYEEPNNET